MADTLSGLARDVAALTRSRRDYRERGGNAAARALAERFETFAAENPGLDPVTHQNYLVRLARCIDPRCPANLDEVLAVLRGAGMSGTAAELDAITRDLDETTTAWVAAGYPLDGPEADAREAVFLRLREWNTAREQRWGGAPRG